MTLGIAAIAVAILSLAWGIGWAIWSNRQSKLIRVTCEPAVIFSSKGMYFTRKGSKKKVPVKPGQLRQPCLSIFAHNIGPTPVGIENVTVSPKNKRTKIYLQNCWLIVEKKDRVPKVLPPGETWEGLCDYFWLLEQLKENFGDHRVWNLIVRVWDVHGRAYKNEVVLSDDIFAAIQRKRA